MLWRRGRGVCPGEAVWRTPGLQGEAERLWEALGFGAGVEGW